MISHGADKGSSANFALIVHLWPGGAGHLPSPNVREEWDGSHMSIGRSLAPAAGLGHRRRHVVALAASMILSFTLPVTGADAYSVNGQGCRFDPGNDDDGLGVGIWDTTPAKTDSTRIAQGYWNRKLDSFGVVGPDFTNVSYGSNQRDVRVISTSNLPSNEGAHAYWWCGSSHYTEDPMWAWNNAATYYHMHNAKLREATASHEFGHMYGLAHNGTFGCDQNIAGIMWSDAVAKSNLCNWAGPSIDDADGASRVHVGWY